MVLPEKHRHNTAAEERFFRCFHSDPRQAGRMSAFFRPETLYREQRIWYIGSTREPKGGILS